jgi:hypothetical protein
VLPLSREARPAGAGGVRCRAGGRSLCLREPRRSRGRGRHRVVGRGERERPRRR